MTKEDQNLDETQVPDDDDGSGKEPDKGAKTFTQEEVNKVVKDRLARERQKYADYDELKGKAAQLAEYEEAQKTEHEKLSEARDKAEQERDEALKTANDRLIRAEFISQASRMGVKHPEDAYLLADLTTIEFSDGKVQGVEDAVKELVEKERLPLLGKEPAPDLNGGAGGGKRADDLPKLTPEQKEAAAKMNVPAEDYAKNVK